MSSSMTAKTTTPPHTCMHVRVHVYNSLTMSHMPKLNFGSFSPLPLLSHTLACTLLLKPWFSQQNSSYYISSIFDPLRLINPVCKSMSRGYCVKIPSKY